MPPLEVECKSLWRPRNVAPAFWPDRVSRELWIGTRPRNGCFSATEQLFSSGE